MIDANSQFFAILTNVGMAKQANADALGIPWKLTDMGVGDANGTDPVPSATQTRLINEWRRRPLNQLKIDPSNAAVIIAEQVIPADEGGKWIREIGLYDADGDLVAVANCAPSFKPVLSQGSGRTQIVRMNFIVTSTGNISLKIDPAVVLATREYVDTRLIEELYKLDNKQSVRVATTANITLTGLLTIDGIVLVAGDRVLVKNQVAAKDNGLYIVAAGAWSRAPDADSSAEVTSALLVSVEQGATLADTRWQLVTDGVIVLGTTVLTFQNVTQGFAPINSPALLGTPLAPTAPAGTNTTQIATTEFVTAVQALLNTALGLKAPLASPALTGVPLAPTAVPGTNTTQVATTAFVTAVQDLLNTALGLKAPLASPTLTGVPLAPTAVPGTNTTQVATTAFVTAVQALMNTARALKAPLASPALTGVPTAPTAALGSNTTQVATTAFIQAALASLVDSSPDALNTLNELATALGNDPNFATTITNALAQKAPLASPTLTGDPKAPTPTPGDNDVSLATTAFVQNAVNGTVAVNVAGAGTITLTTAQAGVFNINLFGAMTGARTIVVPNGFAGYQITNNTTGAFTVTVKTAAGAGVVVTQGKSSLVYCDGSTGVYLQQNDFISPVLTGTPTAQNPARFDDSQQLVTTDWVKSRGLELSGFFSVGTTQTIPVSQVGGLLNLTSAGAFTLTLPAVSTVAVGATLSFVNTNAGVATFATSGADLLSASDGLSAAGLKMLQGDTLTLTAYSSGWVVSGGSLALKYSKGQFSSSPQNAGYFKLPSGLTLQWTTATFASQVVGGAVVTANVTWPLAFTTAHLCSVACLAGGAYGTGGSIFTNNYSLNGCTATMCNPAGNATWAYATCMIFAIGA